jgi:predicted RNA-binding protein YlxR (DUF448 family)
VTRGPERTCVGCRRRAPKVELLRIAATTAGAMVDPAQVAPGRGAYVHRDAGCVRAIAARPDVLARALRTGLGSDELGRLIDEIETGAT